MNSPKYHGQEMHLKDGAVHGPYNAFRNGEDDVCGTKPISVFVGSATSVKESAKSHGLNLHSIHNFARRIFATVKKISELCSIELKIYTGADPCVTTTNIFNISLFQLTSYHVVMF